MAKESKIMRLRTVSALQAVKRYPAYDKHDLRGSIIDVLVDCLHLATKKGLDCKEMVDMALDHYAAEHYGTL